MRMLYPAEELIILYHERWEQELVFDEQKTHQDPRRATKPAHLRSETPAGVIQEIYALSLGHFVIRSLMFEAAATVGLDPDRLSFTGLLPDPASAGCRNATARRPEAFEAWYRGLLWEMQRERTDAEVRRNRINPRVIKRKMRFIRKQRARGLKNVDMLTPLGVVSRDSKPGGQHVHQPVVSRLRHPRLRVRPHRLPGRRRDLHHPAGPRDLPLLGLRLPRGHPPRPRRAPFLALPIGSRQTTVALPIPRVECQACGRRPPGQGPLRRPAAELHPVLRALRPGAVAPHDHPRRGPSPRRRLGHDQGHPEARPVAAVRQAQAQAPPRHRHRRDRRRQGASLPHRGHGPRQRRRRLRRRRQGGRCAEAVLEAAAAQRGEDRGGGHGHVGGATRRRSGRTCRRP